jgi:maleylacetate reductase
MLEFEYEGLPSHVIFGVGAGRGPELARAIDGLGVGRVLLVAAEAERELAAALARGLGDRIAARFTDVHPHVPVAIAEAARAAATDARADAVLSVGGGSTTGTAKAIALTTGMPIVAIPTTYAGSEVTPVWGLTERGHKRTGNDPRVLPRVVLYDPELTVSLPPRLSAVSGLNALAHCAEALWAPKRNPITSLAAEEGIRALAVGLPDVLADPRDLEARSQALYGAWLAGSSFAQAGADVHHKICHVLGGAYDLPHAETHAVVLPYATALAAPRVQGVDARIAAALGAPQERAAIAIAGLAARLSAPVSLRELGLREEQLSEAVDLIDEALAQLPDPVSRTETRALLEAAFAGASPIPEVTHA